MSRGSITFFWKCGPLPYTPFTSHWCMLSARLARIALRVRCSTLSSSLSFSSPSPMLVARTMFQLMPSVASVLFHQKSFKWFASLKHSLKTKRSWFFELRQNVATPMENCHILWYTCRLWCLCGHPASLCPASPTAPSPLCTTWSLPPWNTCHSSIDLQLLYLTRYGQEHEAVDCPLHHPSVHQGAATH